MSATDYKRFLAKFTGDGQPATPTVPLEQEQERNLPGGRIELVAAAKSSRDEPASCEARKRDRESDR